MKAHDPDARIVLDSAGNPDVQANALRIGRIALRYQAWLELHNKAAKHERVCGTGTVHVNLTKGEVVPGQRARCFRVDVKTTRDEEGEKAKGEIFIVSCPQAPPFPEAA